MKNLYLTLLTVPFILFGCSGEDSNGSTSSINGNGSVEQETVVYTQDSIVRTYTEQKLSVDLSERNSISNSEALSIYDITNITGSSQCDPVAVSGMTFELDAFENPTMCQYQYSLRSVESGITFINPRMVTNVMVEKSTTIMPKSLSSLRSLPSTTLPPTQASISVPGSVANINLNSQLASLYPKDSEGNSYVLSSTILVLGSGSAKPKAITGELTTSIVEYTSDASDLGGITRLIYSLSDDFDGDGVGDFKVGAIDISVSASGSNSNPETKYFQWTNNGSDIKVDQKYTIDVASDISAECTYGREEQDTKGSCIYDADSDALQLVGVYAYDATVAPTSLIQLDNTEFDITFSRTGFHDISYQVSDHNGGFATGIVRVYVKENTPPILTDNPNIIYMDEVTDLQYTIDAFDIDGDELSYKSVTQPAGSKVTVIINNANKGLNIDTSIDSEGIYSFDAVVTDGVNDVTQHWVVIVNSRTHLSLKAESDRTFTTNVNTPITINIADLIEGYGSLEKASVAVKSLSGALLGTTKVSDDNNYEVVYTPNSNIIGVDDFIFEIQTNIGAKIAGNVIVHVGNPPVLEIAAIDAIEGDNDSITASVICEYCDVSKFEYRWVINGKLISDAKSFIITQDQRAYKVSLFVNAYDVFGQSTFGVNSFDFFKISTGTFNNPAESCDAIFNMYNSDYSLVADDDEYWINGASGKYKTQCDMVSYEQALVENKSTGGYTLIWSYSERTNLTRFGGNSAVFSQNGKGLHWGTSSSFVNGIGLVSNESASVNYNNFRISASEAARLNNRKIRLNYTSDTSVNTIDSDPDNVVGDWLIETTTTDNYSLVGGYLDNWTYGGYGIGWTGRVRGLDFEIGANSSMKVYFNGERPLTTVDYAYVRQSSNLAWHFWVWVPLTTNSLSLGVSIDTLFGGWNATLHDGADLFGKCISPGSIYILGIYALGCNGGTSGAMTYHENINNNEGYVMQWWVK